MRQAIAMTQFMHRFLQRAQMKERRIGFPPEKLLVQPGQGDDGNVVLGIGFTKDEIQCRDKEIGLRDAEPPLSRIAARIEQMLQYFRGIVLFSPGIEGIAGDRHGFANLDGRMKLNGKCRFQILQGSGIH